MNKECIYKLKNFYRAITSFEADLQRKVGLNINETMLLCLISEKGSITSGEIADEMELTHSNASKVIAALEKKSLIKRRTCKEDKRCMIFGITKKGDELLAILNCEQLQMPGCLKFIASDNM